MILDPKTPVMPGAVRMWEREVKELGEALAKAEARLAHATGYLAALKERTK